MSRRKTPQPFTPHPQLRSLLPARTFKIGDRVRNQAGYPCTIVAREGSGFLLELAEGWPKLFALPHELEPIV